MFIINIKTKLKKMKVKNRIMYGNRSSDIQSPYPITKPRRRTGNLNSTCNILLTRAVSY